MQMSRSVRGESAPTSVCPIPHWESSYKLIHSNNKSAPRLLQHARRALAINQQIPSVMRGRWGLEGRRARRARGAATVILCNWQVGLIATHHVPYSTLGQTVNKSVSWNVRAAAGWRGPFSRTRGRLLILAEHTKTWMAVVCDWQSTCIDEEVREEFEPNLLQSK